METGRIVWLGPEKYKSLIDERETAIYLGYKDKMPDADMQKELRRCADMFLAVVQPRFMFIPVRLLWDDKMENQGFPNASTDVLPRLAADFGTERLALPGEAIYAHLGGQGLAVAACLTLGGQVDELIDTLQKESMLDALLTDALANAAVERLRMYLEQDAKEVLGLAVGWLFGIGYEDFPLAIQQDFLRCIHAEEGIGLSANEQRILSPLKSVTGFLNISGGQPNSEKHCNGRCGMCPKREKCRFFRGIR